jgi:hypothetical protein
MEKLLNFLNENSEAIMAASAIIIAGLAIYGIREWKRQIKGKTNYEIARRYLRASLSLRNAILYVRNPFISVSEMQTALKEHGFESEEYKDTVKTNMAVYSRRWKKVQDAWADLEAELLDAEVSWGTDAVNASNSLIGLTKELFAALQMYIDGHREKIKDELIYNQGSPDNPDEFSKKIASAIEEIKEFLKPHLL